MSNVPPPAPGTPTSPTAAAPQHPQKKGSPAKWWFLGCGIALVMMLLCGGGIFGIMSAAFGLIKGSEPYARSLSEAQNHPAVIAELGEPIEAGWLVSGSVNLENNDGEAMLTIPLNGPDGSGSVYCAGTKTNGVWTFDTMEVTIKATGQKIDLLSSP